jgi:hypothetical protein
MEDDCWNILALENVNCLAASIALKAGQKETLAFARGSLHLAVFFGNVTTLER